MPDKNLTCKMDKANTDGNFFEDLMVILVIYKMEINKSPAFNSLTTSLKSMNQKSSVFIYDNSPDTHPYTPNENWKITYRNDPSNPGVSKAYNEGFKHAKAQGKKWLLLADQDTVFEKKFFLKCKSTIEVRSNEKIFVPILRDLNGIVSPFIFRFGRGIRLKEISAGQQQMTKLKFINSGMLISTSLFELSGGFDERFALDFSDLAFINKLKSTTKTFLVTDSTCKHSLFVTKRNSLEETLVRFKIYCQSANLLGNQTGDSWVFIWKHLRAIKLFSKYFNWRFITIALEK
jgi:GT2 family glycosyltransferase